MTRQIHVIELDESFPRRVADKPHVYVCAANRDPEAQIAWLKAGSGPDWIAGRVVCARPELVFSYQPNNRVTTINRRLKETKDRLIRAGYAVNGFTTTWRVYVLDVDADHPTSIQHRGTLGKVVYVGQTSKPISVRLAEHRGVSFGLHNRYLGAQSVKGRSPSLNQGLTPDAVLFTEDDARRLEADYAAFLESKGYRVLGDGIRPLGR